MNTTVNQTPIEKNRLAQRMKIKSENDVVLYWHWESTKEEIFSEIEEGIKNLCAV